MSLIRIAKEFIKGRKRMERERLRWRAAVCGGDLSTVQSMLSENPEWVHRWDSHYDEGKGALMVAALLGHVDVVNALLPGGDLTRVDSQGATALILAAYEGRTEVVRALLPGSDLQHADHFRRTALVVAAFRGRAEVVKALIAGSDLRQTDRDGCTALMLAAKSGHAEVVKLLIPGSDLSQRANDGELALEKAVAQKNWPCVDLLAAHHTDCDSIAWPADAKPQDLPQWFARRERQAIADEIGSTGRAVASVVPVSKPRNRL